MLKILPILLLAVPAHAAVINDLVGPGDYGATVMPARYDLAGLTAGDTRQGYINNCWLKAVELAIVLRHPDALARNYQVQPNGSIDVTLYRNGSPTTWEVTPDINPYYGNPYTPFDDSNGDAAAAIIDKAYAAYRSPSNTMADENWGLPVEAIPAFGWTSQYLASISQVIAAYQSGDIAIFDTGSIVIAGMVQSHSYPVVGVDAANQTITVRSPWGDGYEPDYHEFITLDASQFSLVNVGAWAGIPGGAAPVPEPATLAMFIPLILAQKRK